MIAWLVAAALGGQPDLGLPALDPTDLGEPERLFAIPKQAWSRWGFATAGDALFFHGRTRRETNRRIWPEETRETTRWLYTPETGLTQVIERPDWALSRDEEAFVETGHCSQTEGEGFEVSTDGLDPWSERNWRCVAITDHTGLLHTGRVVFWLGRFEDRAVIGPRVLLPEGSWVSEHGIYRVHDDAVWHWPLAALGTWELEAAPPPEQPQDDGWPPPSDLPPVQVVDGGAGPQQTAAFAELYGLAPEEDRVAPVPRSVVRYADPEAALAARELAWRLSQTQGAAPEVVADPAAPAQVLVVVGPGATGHPPAARPSREPPPEPARRPEPGPPENKLPPQKKKGGGE